MTDDGATTIERARDTLRQMAELVGDQGHTENSRRWDRLVDQWLTDRRELASSPEGRAAVAELMADPHPVVRLWSSAAVLFWDPEAARPVLTAIREFPAEYDLHSITAKHTLLAFDAGTFGPDDRLPGT
ncbi:MAG: hypothetical protein QM747_09120 [Nocardioides sp.]